MRIIAMALAAILLSIGLAYAQPAPAQRGNAPTTAAPAQHGNAPAAAAPAPRGDAPTAAAPAQHGNAPTAAAPGSADEFKTEAEAKSHCATGNIVWMNLSSHIYHVSGTKDYG